MTDPKSSTALTGKQRSAALLITLGAEASSRVLSRLSDPEIEQLTWEIANLTSVTPEVRDRLLEQAFRAVSDRRFNDAGGISFAEAALQQAFGSERAREMGERMRERSRSAPFSFVRGLEPAQLVTFLDGEHAQTIALILSYLDTSTAAAVLSMLAPGLQSEVALRIARIERIPPDVVRDVEEIVEHKLAALLRPGASPQIAGGPGVLVDLLKGVDRSTERAILDALDRLEPKLAEEIRKHMFVFDNLVQLDDRSIQRILREVDNRDLALALKGAGEEVRHRILKNMSSRAAAMLEDDMNAMGPVRLRNVEAAQSNIVNVVRALDEAEEIVISRGDDEVLS